MAGYVVLNAHLEVEMVLNAAQVIQCCAIVKLVKHDNLHNRGAGYKVRNTMTFKGRNIKK